MRVIGGTARGRRLRAPAGLATRPTPARVREAVFDMLGSLGRPEGAAVADLYAGSGALGVEALSRGAAWATFVDRDRRALDAVRANLEILGPAGNRARLVRADVLAWQPEEPVDVAFCDPPYRFDQWPDLFARLAAALRKGGLVVAESSRPVQPPPGWEVLRSRAYGGTVVTLASVRAPTIPPKGEA